MTVSYLHVITEVNAKLVLDYDINLAFTYHYQSNTFNTRYNAMVRMVSRGELSIDKAVFHIAEIVEPHEIEH